MGEVVCELCPRECRIPEGGAGDCRIRVNLSGKLRATTYGRPSAVHLDDRYARLSGLSAEGSEQGGFATSPDSMELGNCRPVLVETVKEFFEFSLAADHPGGRLFRQNVSDPPSHGHLRHQSKSGLSHRPRLIHSSPLRGRCFP